jgi:4-amino-4-deoxy-L-arabinose transferase-like glycosyltransferase
LRYQWLLRRWELVGVAALLLVALVVRGINLEHVPLNLGGDEGTWGMEGLAMFEGGRLANPFATRWFAFPSLSFLAWGLSIRIFGDSVAGLRALSVLIGTASVLTTYLLARELWGRRVAWLSAALLTFAHFHMHFSRLAVNNVADPLFITLSLWLLVRGLRKRQTIYLALAGAVIGLGWYGYFGARLIGVIAAVYAGGRFLIERRFRARHGWSLVALAGAALVVMAPLLLYYADNPAALAARSRQVSIFASGWLEREQVIAGRSATSLLLQQFWKSISAFNYTLDPTFWYHASIPLLDFVSGAFFVVGLIWTMGRIHRRGNGLLLLWFWSAVILGWVITENPPSSMRLVIIGPALAFLAALGMNWLVGVGQRLLGGGRTIWNRVIVGLLVIVAVLNLRYYFGDYVPTRVYGNPTAEVATVLSRYLKREETDGVVYFYAPPVMYWDFGTLRFMARGVAGVDINQPAGEENVPEIDRTRRAYFVVLPHRMAELDAIRTRYPGGFEFPVYSDADGRLLYVLYEVTAG